MPLTRVVPVYLPFRGEKFRLRLGLTPIEAETWLEFAENTAAALGAKHALLETRHEEVFGALPEAETAAQELLALLATHFCQYHPVLFRTEAGLLVSTATASTWNIADPPLHPLDLAGRLVTEDLCLLQRIGERYVLVGASLSAPARWRLADKLGKTLVAIHEPVPGYAEALGPPVDQFFAALKPERLFCRFNWGIADDPARFQPVAPAPRVDVTPEKIGESLWLRVERQTFRRLPQTGAVVFAIGTEITRLDQAITTTEEARDLATNIREMPPPMQRYKQIAPYASALLAWLENFR